jgi:hypothetical protein
MFVVLAGFQTAVMADYQSCHGKVNAYDCESGSKKHDSHEGKLQVNKDEMFTFKNWEFAQKFSLKKDGEHELTIGVEGIGLTLGKDPDQFGGSWTINDGVWDMYDQIMIVLDSKGKGKAKPNYLGYLLKESDLDGFYKTPFFSNGKDLKINELTVYGSIAAAVPEPTTTVLFLLGLGLLGLSLNRKAKDLPTSIHS